MEEKFKSELEQALKANDKPKAHQLMTTFLSNKDAFIAFYEAIIPGILNAIECENDDAECIWLEHQMSAIVRSLVEASYAELIKHKKKLSGDRHVLIACVQDETHELGAIIGAHLFELYGFQTTFIGANTPQSTLENAIKTLKLDYVVLSATNIYHLSRLNKTIDGLKTTFPKVKIFGSGRGVFKHQKQLHLDGIIASAKDIETLIKKEGLTCSP